MTAPLSTSNRITSASSTGSGGRPAVRTPAPQVAAPQELLCSWVPGTTNIVRLRLRAGRGPERTIELTSASLSRIFGKEAVHELYLKGRARVNADPQQIALLT